METKNLVILGMGMVVGYLLTTYMNSLPKATANPCPPGEELKQVQCVQAPCPPVCTPIEYEK